MISFLLGVASGVYLYKNYDMDRMVQDVKPKLLTCQQNNNSGNKQNSSCWEKFKHWEQQYRKVDKSTSSVE